MEIEIRNTQWRFQMHAMDIYILTILRSESVCHSVWIWLRFISGVTKALLFISWWVITFQQLILHERYFAGEKLFVMQKTWLRFWTQLIPPQKRHKEELLLLQFFATSTKPIYVTKNRTIFWYWWALPKCSSATAIGFWYFSNRTPFTSIIVMNYFDLSRQNGKANIPFLLPLLSQKVKSILK